MTGSDLIVQTLIDSGVSVCFGYPGGAAMPLYDALYKKRAQIRHIRSAHEQGASHAADGYARATGKIGVCIATSGPGATNLVTGIATAFSDSSHVLFITANVNSSEIGTDSFQEADIFGITTPICKYNWTVRDPYSLAATLKKALKLSKDGRPGPVLLDIPHDVLSFRFTKNYIPEIPENSEAEARTPVIPDVPDETVYEIVKCIKKAKKPVIIAGGGVGISGAYNELSELAHKAGIHVASTLMACGILPYNDKLNLGMVGAYGNPAAIKFVEEADLVIAVGMRFSNRTHGALSSNKTIIHIDSDAAELNKNVKATIPVNGDAKKVLGRIVEMLESNDDAPGGSMPLRAEVQTATDGQSAGGAIIPMQLGAHVFSENCDKLLSEVFALIKKKLGDVYVVTDVGVHQMATARLYPFERPGRLITSGGFGTMGFGIGADIGVSVAAEDKKSAGAVLITGDGSFRMSLNELASVKENKIKTLIIVINNKSLGMVRDIQKKTFGRRYIATDASYRIPDFRMIARAYGLRGFVARNVDDFEKALDEYIGGTKTAIVDLRI